MSKQTLRQSWDAWPNNFDTGVVFIDLHPESLENPWLLETLCFVWAPILLVAWGTPGGSSFIYS